jgi:hypothetical protein
MHEVCMHQVAVVLSWRETKTAAMKNIVGSLNKVCVLGFCCCYPLLHLPPLGRGGCLESDFSEVAIEGLLCRHPHFGGKGGLAILLCLQQWHWKNMVGCHSLP